MPRGGPAILKTEYDGRFNPGWPPVRLTAFFFIKYKDLLCPSDTRPGGVSLNSEPPFLADRVQQVIGQIYAGIADPALFPAAFDGAARLVGAKGMLIGPLTPQVLPSPGLVAYASAAFHEAIPDYLAHYLPLNPRKNWLTRNRITDAVFSDMDFTDAREMTRDAFYNDFLIKHGNLHSLDRVASRVIDGASLWISAQYDATAEAPDQAQRDLFAVLSGHIAQAISLSRTLHQDRAAAASFETLVQHYDCAALVIGVDGTLLCVNARARALDGRGLSFRGRQVTTTSPRDAAAFAGLLRGALMPLSGKGLNLMRTANLPDGSSLLLRASPCQTQGANGSFIAALSNGTPVLLIAEDLRPGGAVFAEQPLRFLGLTAAEARVAARVGAGQSPEEVAAASGVAISTVRLHLRRVYDKLGLNRQLELARLISRLEKFS